MISLALLMACAPAVAPVTMQKIVQVESASDELAINVNGARQLRHATDAADAARLARQAIQAGYSVDLGASQVNSRNLAALGYTVEDMFDTCKNLRAGSTILAANYEAATRRFGEGQAALRAALSAYNTGSFERGFANGYVARYYLVQRGQAAHAGGAGTLRNAKAAIAPRIPDMPDIYGSYTTVFIRKVENHGQVTP